MITKYKYIYFEKDTNDPKEWIIKNNSEGIVLGFVSYYKPWKQYVVEFFGDEVFNNQCLRDAADFLDQLNKGGQ